MNPYEVYVCYLALCSHFKTEKYDYFQYNGKVKSSVNSFETRKDKYQFYKISKQRDPMKYILANIIDARKFWVGDFTNDVYERWDSRRVGIEYYFMNEVNSLDSISGSIKVLDGRSKLYNMLRQKKVSIETVVILNKMFNFFPHWKQMDEVIYPKSEQLILEKYTPFVSFNRDKIKKILETKLIT